MLKKILRAVTLITTGVVYGMLYACRATAPDMILVNGKIFTADTANLYIDALAIKGNVITATGNTQRIERLAGKFTQRIDLKGKTVVPGFNDAHAHVGWNVPGGNTYHYKSPTLYGPSKRSVIDSLQLLVKRSKKGEWIYGTIGLTALCDTLGFRRKLLDSIAPDNPVVLQVWWGHGMIVNSEALRQVYISEDAVDPIGGWYERTKNTRQLSGAVHEYAQWPFWNALTWNDTATFIRDLKFTDRNFIRHGVTSFQQMNILQPTDDAAALFKKANLQTRCRLVPMIGSTAMGRSLRQLRYKNITNAKIYISGVKYLIDGTSLDRTALLTSAYKDKPHWYGRLDFPVDTVKQILYEALRQDRQAMLHVVGDSAMAVVLTLMKATQTDDVWRTRRLRIEHNATRYITAEQMEDVKALGIIMMHTPQYGHASKLATWVRNGVPIGIAPDGLVNPFVNLKIVVSEQRVPEENLTLEQAILAYTIGNAYAEFEEHIKGSLTIGKVADLVVLSQDIFSIPINDLTNTKSVLTMIDGKIVYQE